MLWALALLICLFSVRYANNRVSILLILLLLLGIVATSTKIADYDVYLEHYEYSDMFILEPLYQSIIHYCNKLGLSFTLFRNLIFFSIFLSSLFLSHRLQANVYIVFLGYLILLFPLQLTWLRMSLAFSIGYFGVYNYLIRGDIIKTIILLTIPIFIHAGFSAVPLILLVSSIKKKKIYYSLLICAVIMTFFASLPFMEKGVNLLFPSEQSAILEARYSADEITISKVYRLICIVFCALSSAYLLNRAHKLLLINAERFNISNFKISIVERVISINMSTLFLMPITAIYDDFYRIQLYLFIFNLVPFSYVFKVVKQSRSEFFFLAFVQIISLFYLFIGRINFDSVFKQIL